MTNIVDLFARSPQLRTSAVSRAAKRAKRSKDKPRDLAVSVDTIDVHQSAGIASRCHHFDTAEARAPTSDAMDSRDGQSSTTDRNDDKSVMSESIGQAVLKSKDVQSLDGELPLGQNVPMASKTLTDFECRFLARTYAARRLKYETQEEIAELLGMKQDSYKQYEVRNTLPLELVDRFVKLTGINYEWLITGRGPGPAWQERYEKLLEKQAERRAKPKRGKRVA